MFVLLCLWGLSTSLTHLPCLWRLLAEDLTDSLEDAGASADLQVADETNLSKEQQFDVGHLNRLLAASLDVLNVQLPNICCAALVLFNSYFIQPAPR